MLDGDGLGGGRDAAVLDVAGLTKDFKLTGNASRGGASIVRAVDSLDLRLAYAETVALVGESGCGKSTTGRLMVRLLEPTSGRILFDGLDITHLSAGPLRTVRRRLQIVFQDPYASLNPRLSINEVVAEPLRIHRLYKHRGGPGNVSRLLERVGLTAESGRRKPREFSGGQRQRIAIARALALEPVAVILDEPVSALDLSVQAQIINLLEDLRDELGLAYVFISHDLSVVKHLSHRVAVMYLGRIVEVAPTARIFADPAHPYTKALLSAIPSDSPQTRRLHGRIRLTGDVPSAAEAVTGCAFHKRCWKAQERCAGEVPVLRDGEDSVACFYPEGERHGPAEAAPGSA